GNAHAVANLLLHAASGTVTVGGQIDVRAVADDLGGGEAIASALTGISAHGSGGAGGGVELGGLLDSAKAGDGGSGFAKAKAVAVLGPATALHVHNNAAVLASAVNNGTGSSLTNGGASAEALLAVIGTGKVTVDGNVVASAFATNKGTGSAHASG